VVNFFEKLQAESRGRSAEFFSSHPNPENRIGLVQQEIQKLGGVPRQARDSSSDFATIKRLFGSMPVPARSGATGTDRPARTASGKPANPSGRLASHDTGDIRFQHPDNWRVYGQGNAVTVAPDGGIINNSLAYGMMIATFEPQQSRSRHPDGRPVPTIEQVTNQLIDELRQSNPEMRIVRSAVRVRVSGRNGLSMELVNESPTGARERDWVVTVMDPDGLLYYFVGVAPERDFFEYERAFEQVISSFRFS
jgi:predicted Zn-dependent protease